MQFLIVFLGAGLGGALRHAVNVCALRWFGPNFPWGTLCVNVFGCLMMGVVTAWLMLKSDDHLTQPLRLFLATGLLGGFTTFSAFSLDIYALWERGEAGMALFYAVSSVIVSLIGLVLGFTFIRNIA
jgi:fluoride exporter